MQWPSRQEIVGAKDCIIATNVSHIYNKDPKESDDAKPFFDMTIDELISICGTERLAPGQSAVVDPIAVSIVADHKINIKVVLDGRKTLSNTPLTEKFPRRDHSKELITWLMKKLKKMFQRLPIKCPTGKLPSHKHCRIVEFLSHQMLTLEFVNQWNVWTSMKKNTRK